MCFLKFATHVEDNLMDEQKLFHLWKAKRLVLVHMGDYLPKYMGQSYIINTLFSGIVDSVFVVN
jgi:hypothetical protein